MTAPNHPRRRLLRDLAKLRKKFGAVVFDSTIGEIAHGGLQVPDYRPHGRPRKTTFTLWAVWLSVEHRIRLKKMVGPDRVSKSDVCKAIARNKGITIKGGDQINDSNDTLTHRQIYDTHTEAEDLLAANPALRERWERDLALLMTAPDAGSLPTREAWIESLPSWQRKVIRKERDSGK